MKILITGGFGYLGAHLVEWFCKKKDCDVVVLDRPQAAQQSRTKFRFISTDIADGVSLAQVLNEPFDFCIHTASVNDSFIPGYSEMALSVNAGGTRNLLEALRSSGLKRFIYLSTVHVYGANSGRINENTPPAPINDYALTHWFGEQYVRMFQRLYNFPYVILRLTNVYGAPCRKDSSKWYLVLNDLARMAHDRKEIVLKSNGTARRDFIWVGDLCRIIECLLVAPKADQQTLNIGTGRTFTVIELAEIVKEVYMRKYGVAIKIRVNKEDKNIYPEIQVDCTRLGTFIEGKTQDRFYYEIERVFDLLDEELA